MLFLRGSFRPLFSYGFPIADCKVFSGAWTCLSNELLLAINLIVLVFCFGERTVRNLMPLFTKLLARRIPRRVFAHTLRHSPAIRLVMAGSASGGP